MLNLDSIIYVDTDTIFLTCPKKFWNIFKNMSSKQIAAVAKEEEIDYTGYYYELSEVPFYGLTGNIRFSC